MTIEKKNIKQITVFILFLAIVVFLLNMITPFFYRRMPNDYIRTKLIINTLADSTKHPDIVIFGNSRGMSGMNGYRLEELLPQHTAYSLTSTSQMISESALYYTSLPSSVKTVIQCIDLDYLSKPIELKSANQIALHMFGYKMDNLTRSLVPKLYDELSRPSIYYNYEARGCIFMGLTTFLRNKLDDDVVEGATEFDLKYPYSTTTDRNEMLYNKGIIANNQENKFADYTILPEWKQLINASYKYFTDKGIFYCIIIMPYNPDINYSHFPEKDKALEMFLQSFPQIPTLNCINSLEPSDFYDAIHPNRIGGEKITTEVAFFLNEKAPL